MLEHFSQEQPGEEGEPEPYDKPRRDVGYGRRPTFEQAYDMRYNRPYSQRFRDPFDALVFIIRSLVINA
jgi:hypothetical protein